MPDEQQPDPRPIHLVQHTVFVMEGEWPERTAFGEDFLGSAHLRHATYDREADTVTFDIFNGGAIYVIRRDLPAAPGMVLADLADGSGRKTTRRP